jgi:hypothetical protein
VGMLVPGKQDGAGVVAAAVWVGAAACSVLGCEGAATGAAVAGASQPADATPDLAEAGAWFLRKLPDRASEVRAALAAPDGPVVAAWLEPDWLLSTVRKSVARAGSAAAASMSELRRTASGIYAGCEVVLSVGMT